MGPLFFAKFDLPANIDPDELAVIQCRTKDNQLNNKMFFLNHKPLPDILEPHPNNKDEWMMDIAIVPKGWLKPGENNIHIGYADERYDDFIVDNLVMWYKVKPKVPEPEEGEPDHTEKKEIDSLEDLSSLDVKVYKDEDAKHHFPG